MSSSILNPVTGFPFEIFLGFLGHAYIDNNALPYGCLNLRCVELPFFKMDLSGMQIFYFRRHLETICVMTACLTIFGFGLSSFDFSFSIFCGLAHFRVYNRLLHCSVFDPC